MSVSFGDRLAQRVRQAGSPSCVGIDPHLDRVPGVHDGLAREDVAALVRRFALGVVEAVAPHVAAVKPQVAFFEALGAPGVAALEDVVHEAKRAGLIVVLDAKRGDIGSTSRAYARATIDDAGPLGADAVTLSPYLGPESLQPYETYLGRGKGVFVLVRTSNPGAGPWQHATGMAACVAGWLEKQAVGSSWSSAGAVVAATLSQHEVTSWRARLPNTWFLVPGFGAQGAGPDDVRAHFRDDGLGALVTASRSVLFGEADRESRDAFVGAIAARARTFAASSRLASGG